MLKIKNLIITLLIYAVYAAQPVFASPLAEKVIVLDPGHGAKNNSGQIVNGGCRSKAGLSERDKTVGIAGILSDMFLQQGSTVYFTRDKDNFWRSAESQDEDNRSRAEFANSKKADLFLRIHCNWSPNKKQRGVLILWYKNDSKKIAETVLEEIKKTGVRTEGVVKKHLVGFQYAEVPAILIEYGYFSNKDDEKLLKDEKYIKKISGAVIKGLEKYFEDESKVVLKTDKLIYEPEDTIKFIVTNNSSEAIWIYETSELVGNFAEISRKIGENKWEGIPLLQWVATKIGTLKLKQGTEYVYLWHREKHREKRVDSGVYRVTLLYCFEQSTGSRVKKNITSNEFTIK